MDASPLVHVDQVEKQFRIGQRTIDVLRGVSFSISANELVSLVGPSGSGKSTIVNILGGLDRPTRGTVSVNGQALGALNDRRLAEYRSATVGMIFQSFNLLPHLSAWQNILLPAVLRGTPKVEAEKRATELLSRVGLTDRRDHRPAELSGGEQQRIAIIRSIINQPRFLLADEPTGNLDSTTSREVIDLLISFCRETKAALLIITHDQRIADRTDRLFRLEDGRLINGEGS